MKPKYFTAGIVILIAGLLIFSYVAIASENIEDTYVDDPSNLYDLTVTDNTDGQVTYRVTANQNSASGANDGYGFFVDLDYPTTGDWGGGATLYIEFDYDNTMPACDIMFVPYDFNSTGPIEWSTLWQLASEGSGSDTDTYTPNNSSITGLGFLVDPEGSVVTGEYCEITFTSVQIDTVEQLVSAQAGEATTTPTTVYKGDIKVGGAIIIK